MGALRLLLSWRRGLAHCLAIYVSYTGIINPAGIGHMM
jgi:hypothetical protein